MNTTELIALLKKVEKGVSGRSREISITFDGKFIPLPEIEITSTGDGVAGAELTLAVRKTK